MPVKDYSSLTREELIARIQALDSFAQTDSDTADLGSRLAAIIEFSDDAIVRKDLTGRVTAWNRAAEHIFGYTAGEMLGQPIEILVPPDRVDEEPKILERLQRGERINHFETLRRHKDGRLIPVSLAISPIQDASGQIIGALKVARDISSP